MLRLLFRRDWPHKRKHVCGCVLLKHGSPSAMEQGLSKSLLLHMFHVSGCHLATPRPVYQRCMLCNAQLQQVVLCVPRLLGRVYGCDVGLQRVAAACVGVHLKGE
jgi:hypothetical protein